MESKLKNKVQIAVSGRRHTVTTDKNKVIYRKLISNPLPSQQTTTPAKKINTRQNTADQPTCSKTLDNATTSGAPCIYSMRDTEEHRKLRKKRGLVEKKRNIQKQQGTIYLTKQKYRKVKT